MITAVHLSPATWQQRAHPIQRFSNTKPRSGIKCACPIKAILKHAVAWPRRVVAVTDNRRMNLGLFVFTDPKESRPFRRANPLVEVTRVISGVQPPKVDG